MFIETTDQEVSVYFEASDSPVLRTKTAAALGYCCADASGVELVEGGDVGIVARLATNASPEGALMLIENVTAQHQVEGSPTFIEQMRDEVTMSDGLPFVMNH